MGGGRVCDCGGERALRDGGRCGRARGRARAINCFPSTLFLDIAEVHEQERIGERAGGDGGGVEYATAVGNERCEMEGGAVEVGGGGQLPAYHWYSRPKNNLTITLGFKINSHRKI